MIQDRTEILLQKQQSLNNRLRKEQLKASKDAKARGLKSTDEAVFVDSRLQEYREVELIRRSVKDVKKRGSDLEKFRKLQGKAYEGVKSKVGRNIKVVERVNRVNASRCDVTPTKRRPRTVIFNAATINVKRDLTP